jgi:hypothetical protein
MDLDYDPPLLKQLYIDPIAPIALETFGRISRQKTVLAKFAYSTSYQKNEEI